MNDVTKRFIEVYTTLINDKIVSNASDFAQKIGVSTSLITEMLKGRSNVGVTTLQNTVKYFHVDVNYILLGEKTAQSDNTPINYQAVKPPGDCTQCEGKDRLIFAQKQTIDAQLTAIDALKKRIEDLSGEDLTSGNNGQKRKVG